MLKIIEKKCSFNCAVTEFYKPLFEEFVMPSFANSKIKINVTNDQNIFGQGFGQPEFIKSIILKLEKVIESLYSDEFVVWMDVDLFFTKNPEIIMADLQKRIKNFDILISPEDRGNRNINSGFFLARSSEASINFFKNVLFEVSRKKITEQPVVQKLLYEKKINFNILPIIYWNLTVGWPIPNDALVLHANWAVDRTKLGPLIGENYVERKIDALRKLRQIRYDIGKLKN
jgi:hypothetical protein